MLGLVGSVDYLIDLIWQAHLEGRDHGFGARNVVLHPELSALWTAQQAVNQWYIDWSDRQSPDTLAEVVHMSGCAGRRTRGYDD